MACTSAGDSSELGKQFIYLSKEVVFGGLVLG